jgi:N-acyl-D-amino-acid deacylase
MTRLDAVREFDPDGIVLAEIPPGPNAGLEGRSLADVARDAGQDPLDVAFHLLVEEGAGIVMVVFGMAEDDVRRVMSHSAVAIASDGWTLDPSAGGTPHPRSYGTFPRVLGRYVREEGVLSLEAAVHKMTGLPARRLRGLRRGHIETGFVADIVVFDPAAVCDVATYSDPHRFSVGLEHVFVGGVPVIEDRLETGARPGSVLTRKRRADPVE